MAFRGPRDGESPPRCPPARRAGGTFGRRVQLTSVRFTERLEEIGARPSIGTVADSSDDALAETTNGLSKAECVSGPDANGWEDVSHLELATLSWVHWFNEQRLHSYCNDVSPAEFEAAFSAAQEADQPLVGIQWPQPPPNPRWFTSPASSIGPLVSRTTSEPRVE